MILRALILVMWVWYSVPARAADGLPEGWEWVLNGEKKIVGAMYFGKDESLGRHVKKTARFLKSDRLFLAFHARDRTLAEAVEVAKIVKAKIESEKRTIKVVHLSSCESAIEFEANVPGIDSLAAEKSTEGYIGRVWASSAKTHLPARAQILADSLGLPVIGEIPKVENEEAIFRAKYIYENYAHDIAHPEEFAARQKLFFPGSLGSKAKEPVGMPFRAFVDENYDGFAPPGAAKCSFHALAG